MKTISPRLLAATALALMMTEIPQAALAAQLSAPSADRTVAGPTPQRLLLLAQAEGEAADEAPADDETQPRRKKRAQQQEEQAPAAEQAPQPRVEPAPEAAPARQPAEEAKPAPEAAPAEAGETRQQRRERERSEAQEQRQKLREQLQNPKQPAEAAPAEAAPAPTEAAPAPAEAAPAPAGETRQQRRERERSENQEQRQKLREQLQNPKQPAETAPAAPAPAQPAPAPAETAPAPAEAAPAPAEAAPAEGETRQQRRERERREQQGEKPADGTAPTTEPTQDTQPAQPAAPEQTPGNQAQPAVPTLPDSGGTPILDSQKEEQRQRPPREGGEQAARPPRPAGPPPASDQDAQKETVKIEDIAPVTREEGRRIDRQRGERREDRERRDGVDVLREIAGRVILDLGGRPTVESDDRQRMSRGARDVYYEELSRGRTRETIVRPNGVQVVTIRDRYGEIVRRSRIMPDGREIVLSYVDEERRGPRGGEWRDPGYDLPPLVLNIPVDEYILDAEDARSDDDYYEFLEQPPVEQVERYYSIDEVKHSARVRDSVRRVDLDTITFDFGSADIKEDAVQRLDSVARAMERMLEKNPAETFLIEGHTDAVGSDLANLALSDRRAEAVAAALTDVFEIPPENLTTQGYGEQYLKVKTEAPEQANRRVAIRRITPLVAPVASAQ